MLVKITEKGPAHIAGTLPDGKPVTISAYKSPQIFAAGRSKSVGEEFEAGDFMESNKGRMYSSNRIEVEKALFEAEQLDTQRALMNLKLRVATAQLKAIEP